MYTWLAFFGRLARKAFPGSSRIELSTFAMEAVILALIAFEVVSPLIRKRTVNRRTMAIVQYLQKGRALVRTVPNNTSSDERANQWVAEVNVWGKNTYAFLNTYGPGAAAAFLKDRMRPTVVYETIHNSCANVFSALGDRLHNLQDILEKPDIYL